MFCKKISRPEALRATIRVGLDLEHPGFFRPLAWTGVQPCRACRAERLGRSVGPSQRNELFDFTPRPLTEELLISHRGRRQPDREVFLMLDCEKLLVVVAQ